MRELIRWMRDVERTAGCCYRDAAKAVANKHPRLSRCLRDLAKEEGFHYNVMSRALDGLGHLEKQPFSAIQVDDVATQKVDSLFVELRKAAADQSLDVRHLAELVVEVEISEWNAVFLYVVAKLRSVLREFEEVSSRMERHKRQVVAMLKTIPDTQKLIARVEGLQRLWNNRILVVDDAQPIRGLLSMMFDRFGQVTTAENGLEGLSALRCRFYDLVVADIDMPKMDGIEFFQEALKIDKEIDKRWIFFAAYPGKELTEKVYQYGVPMLQKPAGIGEIEKLVARKLDIDAA